MGKIPTWVLIGAAVIAALALTTGGVLTVDYLQSAWMASANAQKWAPYLAASEQAYGIPTGLLSRIAYQESHFVQSIIDGTQASPAGALGLMQLEPAYFSAVQVPTPFSDADTQAQISQAAGELARLYGVFGDWTTATAAYNAGQGTITKVLSGTAALPTETANYIASIAQDLPGVVAPSLSA